VTGLDSSVGVMDYKRFDLETKDGLLHVCVCVSECVCVWCVWCVCVCVCVSVCVFV